MFTPAIPDFDWSKPVRLVPKPATLYKETGCHVITPSASHRLGAAQPRELKTINKRMLAMIHATIRKAARRDSARSIHDMHFHMRFPAQQIVCVARCEWTGVVNMEREQIIFFTLTAMTEAERQPVAAT